MKQNPLLLHCQDPFYFNDYGMGFSKEALSQLPQQVSTSLSEKLEGFASEVDSYDPIERLAAVALPVKQGLDNLGQSVKVAGVCIGLGIIIGFTAFAVIMRDAMTTVTKHNNRTDNAGSED